MKNLGKNLFFTAFCFLLGICFLFYAQKTAAFAYIGLKTWFDSMIISLFPFMVLMNLLIKTGLSGLFIRPFYMLLRPLFRNTPDALFVIFFGFLCGFPLGGKCAVDLYQKGRISYKNAEYLLCFSNQIGPAYMLGFFIGTIRAPGSIFFAVFTLYGIPFIYGLILRYTVYRKELEPEYRKTSCTGATPDGISILSALPEAVRDALSQIAILGGYMILFNALRIVPHLMFAHIPKFYLLSQCMLEISGGLLCANTSLPDGILKTMVLYGIFSFNGLCCHFQTFSLLQQTDFSGKKYMLHKIILCSITILFVWCFSMFK